MPGRLDDIFGMENYLPTGWAQCSGYDLEQRGLPTTIRTNQRSTLVLVNTECDVMQYRPVAIAREDRGEIQNC